MKRFEKTSVLIALIVAAMMLIACAPSAVSESAVLEEVSQSASASAAEESSPVVNQDESGEGITIGFSFPTLQEERWAIEKDLCAEYCEQIGVNFVFQDANTDAVLQNQQIDNLITQEVDVLIVGAADIDATASAVKAAKAEGIPVISYLRMINSDQVDAFVGYDFEKIGEIKAQAALENVPEGNYVFLNGDEGDSVVHEMMKGYETALKEAYDSGKVKKIFEQYTQNWEPANALANMENCLTVNDNNVQAVIANNDHVAGAAIQALEAVGITSDVYVNGMDGDLDACQRIVEGKQDATVVFLHSEIVKAAIDTAVAYAKGETPSTLNGKSKNDVAEIDAVLLGADIVTKDNMVEKVIVTGVHKLEEVYANVPKDQWPAK